MRSGGGLRGAIRCTGTEYPGDGEDIALPVIISATALLAVHPDGEVAVADAAASRGTAMDLSSFASKPIADVVDFCSQKGARHEQLRVDRLLHG
jgi:isopentenyl diphosphate isomerase/L-lactate dehydrogenase-like FMN-dependent dehydrogenase